jgi:hypothetical protein
VCRRARGVSLHHREKCSAATVVEPLGGPVGLVHEVSGEENGVDVSERLRRHLEVGGGVAHRLVVARDEDALVISGLGSGGQRKGARAREARTALAERHYPIGHTLSVRESTDGGLMTPYVSLGHSGRRLVGGRDVGASVFGEAGELACVGVKDGDARDLALGRLIQLVGREGAHSLTDENNILHPGELGGPDDIDAVILRYLQERVTQQRQFAYGIGARRGETVGCLCLRRRNHRGGQQQRTR